MGGGARAWGAELAGLRREGALLWRLASALAARACAVSSRSPEAMAMAAAAFVARCGGAPRGESAGLGLASARLLGGLRGARRRGEGAAAGAGGGRRPGALQGLRRVPSAAGGRRHPSAEPPGRSALTLGKRVAAGRPPAWGRVLLGR